MSDTKSTHSVGEEAGHDGGHGHASAGEPLGPVDVTTWAYAIAGSLLGLLVVAVLFVARGA